MSNRELAIFGAYSLLITTVAVAFIVACAFGITFLPVWLGVIACFVVAIVAVAGVMLTVIRLVDAHVI